MESRIEWFVQVRHRRQSLFEKVGLEFGFWITSSHIWSVWLSLSRYLLLQYPLLVLLMVQDWSVKTSKPDTV